MDLLIWRGPVKMLGGTGTEEGYAVRTSARRAGAVAAITAGALLLGGCGSGDDEGGKADGDKKPGTSAPASESGAPSEQAPQSPSQDAPEGGEDGSGGNGSGKSDRLAGIWKAKGEEYVLTFVAGKATLLRERGRNCTGELRGADKRSLALKCPAGDQTRTRGTVGPVKGKTVKVSWKGGPTEVYARVTDVPVKLPEKS